MVTTTAPRTAAAPSMTILRRTRTTSGSAAGKQSPRRLPGCSLRSLGRQSTFPRWPSDSCSCDARPPIGHSGLRWLRSLERRMSSVGRFGWHPPFALDHTRCTRSCQEASTASWPEPAPSPTRDRQGSAHKQRHRGRRVRDRGDADGGSNGFTLRSVAVAAASGLDGPYTVDRRSGLEETIFCRAVFLDSVNPAIPDVEGIRAGVLSGVAPHGRSMRHRLRSLTSPSSSLSLPEAAFDHPRGRPRRVCRAPVCSWRRADGATASSVTERDGDGKDIVGERPRVEVRARP